jgi:serine/threonine protein kinase
VKYKANFTLQCKLIQGAPLNEIQNELTIKEKVQIIKKIAEAIHTAHQSSVIHRDIKPVNIMAYKTGANVWRPCIMDFGLAREIETDGQSTTGIVMGTPCYIAPEQAKGSQLDSRTDVYGLGATLYELLTGRPPFQGKNPVETLYKVIHEDPVLPSTLNPFVSNKMERIVMKCLRKDPAKRYASAQSLAAALEELLESGDITVDPKNQMRKKIFSLVAVALFLIMGVLFLLRDEKDFGLAKKVEENRKTESQSQQKSLAKQKLATISMSHAGNITLHFDDYDIKDLFKAIGSTTGYNIILDPEVSGNTSISLNDVSIHDALKIVCNVTILVTSLWVKIFALLRSQN